MPKVTLDPTEIEYREGAQIIEPFPPQADSTENNNNRTAQFISFATEHGLASPEDNKPSEAPQPENPPVTEVAPPANAEPAPTPESIEVVELGEEPGATEGAKESGATEGAKESGATEGAKESGATEEASTEQQSPPLDDDSLDIQHTDNLHIEDQQEDNQQPKDQKTELVAESSTSPEAISSSITPQEATEEEAKRAYNSAPPLPDAPPSEASIAPSPPEPSDLQQPGMSDGALRPEEAQTEAQKIAQAAEERATLIVQQAQDEAKHITQQAAEQGEERGKREGYQQGYQNGQKALDFAVERLQVITGRLLDQRQSVLNDLEAQIIELALLIAKKVVKSISAKDREVVIENVRQALHLLSAERQIGIRINPDDLRLSEEELKRVTEALEKEKTIVFYADATIEKGGCLIETDLGNIDARISSQLLELEQHIQGIDILRQRRVTS